MSNHSDRMAAIGRVAIPPDHTAAGKALRRFLKERPPSSDVRKAWTMATTRLLAQIDNGAGLPMDSRLRYFLQEYNARNFEHGLHSMPASFNVLEAFVDYRPALNYFRLREEVDHLVSFIDFLEYVTSPSSEPGDIGMLAGLLKEGVVYSFNSMSSPGDVTFSIAHGKDYGVGGFSLVRHSREISVLLLAGEKIDTAQKTEALRKARISLGKRPRGKEKLRPAEDLVREAVPLLGNPDFWETLVLARYDMEDGSEDVRYVMKDAGDSFTVITDDVSALIDQDTGEFESADYEKTAKRMASEISDHATLFELCKTFLLLPCFFEEHAERTRVERHPTQFFDGVKKGRWTTRQKHLTTAERIGHRNVVLLDRQSKLTASSSIYHAPDLQVQVSGYWKTLPLNESGEDKHGNPIHGRTWVKKELSWIHRREDIVVRAERTEGRAGVSPGEDSGVIYVMHNPAHEKDMFKVGLTRRTSELRSEELSRTGAPDKFLVAHEWNVKDCMAAEKAVHQALDSYRINPRREFFRVPYQMLIETMASVLEKFLL